MKKFLPIIFLLALGALLAVIHDRLVNTAGLVSTAENDVPGMYEQDDTARDTTPPIPSPPPKYYNPGSNAAFPSLHITTARDPFIQDRTFWHDGTAALSGAPEGFNFEPVAARFRGRGNSTWWRAPDKRPLRLRFITPQPLLSEYDARDWVLLAEHFDRSLMRNYSALFLGNLLCGLYFTPRAHHIHLYVNGQYMGVYLLTDERNTGPGRLNLAWHEDPAVSCFFLEHDARAYRTGIQDETFITIGGLHYDLRYPNNLSPAHIEYVRAYIGAVDCAIRRQSFDEVRALIDLDSFVDFYIVQEFYKDIDARHLSIFMYITGTGHERRLFKGPIWDFDLAAGNAGHQPMGYGPEGIYVAIMNAWYRYLFNMPEFFEAVLARWNEIRHREIAQTMEQIRVTAKRYQHEFERNFERHPDVMGREQMHTPREILEISTFMGHVEHLINWLETRAGWMDDFLNGRLPGYDHLWTFFMYYAGRSPVKVSVNGELQEFTVPPVTINETIMLVPQELEAIFGVNIDYDVLVTGTATLYHGHIPLVHQTGDIRLAVNGEIFELTIPTAYIIRNRVFVPLEGLANALGYEIYWDGDAIHLQ